MRITKFGTVSVRYLGERTQLCVSDFDVDCEGVSYSEDDSGEVDKVAPHFQRDLLNAILLNIVEGNFEPGIAYSRDTAEDAIHRAMTKPARRPWWRFW